jgi:hypothetical protein
MSDSDRFDFTEEPTTEVELSAQDLLELSPSRGIEQSEYRATQSTVGSPAEESVTAVAQPVHSHVAAAPADRRMSTSRVALALGFVVAAVMAVGALYKYSTPDRPVQSSVTTVPQEAAPPMEESVAVVPEEKQPPVRMTNPFDKTEVFEFPPGTSKADARAAMADSLMKRAIERRDRLDVRLSQRR